MLVRPLGVLDIPALPQYAAAGANLDITSVLLNQTGLKVKGGNAFSLNFKPGTTYTADRVLTITTADANTTMSIPANTTVSGNNTGDQTSFPSVATASIIGRVTAGTGATEVLTGTQATTLLDVATTSLKGLCPVLGGGTTNFLRADGTWGAPSSAPLPALVEYVSTVTQTITSVSPTYVQITTTTSFSPVSGETYWVEGFFSTNNLSASAQQYGVGYAGTATGNFYPTYEMHTATPTAANAYNMRSGKNLTQSGLTANVAASQSGIPAHVGGYFVCTGSGTFFFTATTTGSSGFSISSGATMITKKL
jgi:hypothetical protein